MANSNNEHYQHTLLNLVKNAKGSDAYPAQALQSALQQLTGKWILGQPVNGRNNALPIRSRYARQLPGRTSFNPNRVIHA